MYNIIVTEPSSNLRMLGRQALVGKWKIAIIASLIYEICLTLPPLILDQLFGKTLAELYENLYGSHSYSLGSDFIYTVSEGAEKVSAMSGVYEFLVTGAFTLGISLFFLNLFRRKEADPAQVFSGFEQFFKALGLFFVMGVFISLWTLLFIIPGIIAALRYSQAFFILADDPTKGILQCINESKWMMKGNKGKLFCLELSFFGWMLLTFIVIGMIAKLFSMILIIDFGGVMMAIINWIASLLICWLTAYMLSTEAAFYEILRGNLRANTYAPGQY